MEIRTTREMALRAVIEISEMGKYINVVSDKVLSEHPELTGRERAFINRLIRGTIERRLTLDRVIDEYAKPKVSKQKPYVRNMLRISAYQVLFMDGIRDAAAINEAVALCKKHGFSGLSGFINAILRRIAENKEKHLKDIEDNKDCSLPDEIFEILKERFGDDKAYEIGRAYLSEKPVYIRITDDIIKEKIEQNDNPDIVINKEDIEGVYSIEGGGDVRQIPGYEEGKIFIQDIGAMRVLEDAFADMDDESFSGKDTYTVIDMCAAPGGKTIHAADLLIKKTGKDSLNIIARDISDKKVALINENLERSGYSFIKTEVFDATNEDKENEGKADLVIADVPCSGLGVIGRKPDIKYRVKKEDITELSKLQKVILANAGRITKERGYLLYATCTLTKEENEEQIASFIQENGGFTLVTENTYIPTDKSDGFYMALLRKENER